MNEKYGSLTLIRHAMASLTQECSYSYWRGMKDWSVVGLHYLRMLNRLKDYFLSFHFLQPLSFKPEKAAENYNRLLTLVDSLDCLSWR